MLKKTIHSSIDIAVDDIEFENELMDELIKSGEDIMSDPILLLSAGELAAETTRIKNERAERKQKDAEAAKIKAELNKRIRLLNEKEKEQAYYSLMNDFPEFDMSKEGWHWSLSLIRALNVIDYKSSTAILANSKNIDVGTISYIEIVKSHLNLVTFDHIHSTISEFVAQPDYVEYIKNSAKKSFAYANVSKYKLDENSDSSADPEWGMW